MGHPTVSFQDFRQFLDALRSAGELIDVDRPVALELEVAKAMRKSAMVFDDDVDIWDDNAVQFAMAFRYMPHLDTVTLPLGNTMTVDPMIAEDASPGTASKIGLDCTIPISPKFNPSHFHRSTVFELGETPPNVVVMSEEELTAAMEAFIREAPRTWKEILQQFIGQPYRVVYGAFSNLRHQLGRCDDEPWYRYTFSDTDFAVDPNASPSSNFDPRHRPE
jgi:4-hydroxy-3-polyprenylbenzoate decarboxylase